MAAAVYSVARFNRAAAVVVASALFLSWVALYNGAPLVFSDTIAYAAAALEGEIPGLFSILSLPKTLSI